MCVQGYSNGNRHVLINTIKTDSIKRNKLLATLQRGHSKVFSTMLQMFNTSPMSYTAAAVNSIDKF